jgi:hypothetical protein
VIQMRADAANGCWKLRVHEEVPQLARMEPC